MLDDLEQILEECHDEQSIREVWEFLYGGWEDFPEDIEEAKNLILEIIPTVEQRLLKKVYGYFKRKDNEE